LNLQTKIQLERKSENLVDYQSNTLLVGSCFVENIGAKFSYYKFQNLKNPFGILFNPVAIERLVSLAAEKKIYSENDIFFHNERWHCYDAHSDLSSVSKERLLQNLNNLVKQTHQQLCDATHIIITLGTAWTYKHLETNKIVANCHKIPQKHFLKDLLSVQDIKTSIDTIISNIRTLNSKASIIFTVSPVRHLKDGFVENQQSKAHLVTAIHERLKSSELKDSLHYFPAYEIMMDELRDYRFYKDDMIHPNKTAITYIWEIFKQIWITKEAYVIMNEVEAIQKGLLHKPFNKKSKEYQTFLKKLNEKQSALQLQFPSIKF